VITRDSLDSLFPHSLSLLFLPLRDLNPSAATIFLENSPPLIPCKKAANMRYDEKWHVYLENSSCSRCRKQAVKYIRSNLRVFGPPGMPSNYVGRWPSITPPMHEALCDYCIFQINRDRILMKRQVSLGINLGLMCPRIA